ncbi:MAG TPA: urate hydroxylase PuuD [Gammaproteobacteria bacterium]|nr:urate hydroxylase PuuD [Gammaproteobacteria bacterium]
MNPLSTIKGTIIAGVVLAIVVAILVAALEKTGFAFNVPSFIIWLHVLAGITWIGLLYYFNFVQTPALAAAAKDQGGPGGAGINKYVAPRALLWFRWGAVFTWLTGVAYLAHVHVLTDAIKLGIGSGNLLATYIGVGAWLGTIMLFNVWVLIWPNQKKVLGLVEATAEQIAKARRVAFLASRANTVLSIPMLMSMVSFGHGGFFIN